LESLVPQLNQLKRIGFYGVYIVQPFAYIHMNPKTSGPITSHPAIPEIANSRHGNIRTVINALPT